jgi:hypothetical protein
VVAVLYFVAFVAFVVLVVLFSVLGALHVLGAVLWALGGPARLAAAHPVDRTRHRRRGRSGHGRPPRRRRTPAPPSAARFGRRRRVGPVAGRDLLSWDIADDLVVARVRVLDFEVHPDRITPAVELVPRVPEQRFAVEH